MARYGVLVVLLAGFIVSAPAVAQPDGRPACAEYPETDIILPNGYPFDAHGAVTLFRFHRQKDALRKLDAARATARGPWRWRLPPDRRARLASALDALRNCLAATEPPPLATLTLRVLADGPEASNHIGPQPGARVHVEGVAVGRTGRNGTLTARVPSGPISVEAEVPISHWNWTDINLAPGRSETVEITLSEGKEVSERTVLVLAEAVDDIVPITSKSLTLKFMREGRLAPVTSIDQIDLVDREGNFKGSLNKYFSVVRGELVSTDAGRVFEALAPQIWQTIALQVQAMFDHELHQGTIAFRVGQSPLSVTLAPPPSNPALAVSNIEVGVSLIGAGIALQRVSDANGRLEIESLPHGTIGLECVVVVNGRYYYGDAILAHSGPHSATLVLRNVDDLKNGVPPLRVDPR